MKGSSEGAVRAALNEMSLTVLVYKPPDDARNWKPADFMVWWLDDDWVRKGTALIEVKQSPNKGTFPVRELRPAQREGMVQARGVLVPYWLAIYWPARGGRWTISHGNTILDYLRGVPAAKSLEYDWLASSAGIDCAARDLAPILRGVLLGEVG